MPISFAKSWTQAYKAQLTFALIGIRNQGPGLMQHRFNMVAALSDEDSTLPSLSDSSPPPPSLHPPRTQLVQGLSPLAPPHDRGNGRTNSRSSRVCASAAGAASAFNGRELVGLPLADHRRHIGTPESRGPSRHQHVPSSNCQRLFVRCRSPGSSAAGEGDDNGVACNRPPGHQIPIPTPSH